MPTELVKYRRDSYGVYCPVCKRQLCDDQPLAVADRIATNHDELFHEARLPYATGSSRSAH
jgi:hypothetical protein